MKLLPLTAALMLACAAGPVAAETWVDLTGPEIVTALSARALGYADGTSQDFQAGGRTLAGKSEGRWTVRGDRYCSNWPPAQSWACYSVAREARGMDIRFTAEDGSVTMGRYIDLN